MVADNISNAVALPAANSYIVFKMSSVAPNGGVTAPGKFIARFTVRTPAPVLCHLYNIGKAQYQKWTANVSIVAPTPDVAEEKNAPSSEVLEKPLDSKDEIPAPKHVIEPEANQTPDNGTGKEESAEKMPSEELKPEPTVSMGEKREHDEASSGSNDKSAAESTAKKQKINEKPNGNEESATKKPDTETAEKPAETGSNPPAKRGPGRPKKAEGSKKAPKKQPTPRSIEGIGSRTRSRAKGQA